MQNVEDIKIGARLRQIREQKHLTLKQLSEASGLSIGFISQVEREQVDPSWASLKKISAALNIKLKDLFDTAPTYCSLVRSGEGYQVSTPNIHRELLASIDGSLLEALLTVCAPHSQSGLLEAHSGEEFIWIIDGSLEIMVGNVSHTLNSGDSFYFRSTTEHRWFNNSDQACKVLWIMTPPSLV